MHAGICTETWHGGFCSLSCGTVADPPLLVADETELELPDLDPSVEFASNAASLALERGPAHLEVEIKRLRRAGVNATQGAAVVMRPNGEVLAMVGGIGDNVRDRGFNRAKCTTGLLSRPPASAFKPFVYPAALEMGLTPHLRINARPVLIKVKGDPKPYQPQNYDGKARDFISMREALVESVNTAAVRLLHDEVGFERLFSTLTRLGIQTTGMRKQMGLALGSQGVSLIEMASAYAVFANGGRSVQASGFNAITTADGRVARVSSSNTILCNSTVCCAT